MLTASYLGPVPTASSLAQADSEWSPGLTSGSHKGPSNALDMLPREGRRRRLAAKRVILRQQSKTAIALDNADSVALGVAVVAITMIVTVYTCGSRPRSNSVVVAVVAAAAAAAAVAVSTPAPRGQCRDQCSAESIQTRSCWPSGARDFPRCSAVEWFGLPGPEPSPPGNKHMFRTE